VETARAQIQAADVAVEAATAAVEAAKLNLGFTRLISFIDGIAGLAQQQVGSLVSPNSDPVTTVSTVDPIKVYFTVSEQEYLQFRRQLANETAMPRLQLELILADGSTYPQKGKFSFADRQVDVRTGSIRLVGLFPNPGNILRPGQFGRVRAVTSVRRGALLVPQRAVTELQGTYQVAIVKQGKRSSSKARKESGRAWL
jgi:membrane fusion protein (multidrug efflux system)